MQTPVTINDFARPADPAASKRIQAAGAERSRRTGEPLAQAIRQLHAGVRSEGLVILGGEPNPRHDLTRRDFQQMATDGRSSQRIFRVVSARMLRNPRLTWNQHLSALRQEVFRAEDEPAPASDPKGCATCDCAQFVGDSETCGREGCAHARDAHTVEKTEEKAARAKAVVMPFRPAARTQPSPAAPSASPEAEILAVLREIEKGGRSGDLLTVTPEQGARISRSLDRCRSINPRAKGKLLTIARAATAGGPRIGAHYIRWAVAAIEENDGPTAA